MKLLLILFIIITVLFLIFGEINFGGRQATAGERILISILAGAILSLMIGLPIIGAYALITGKV